MKTLVIYATKTGASFQCANILAQELPHCTLCDIEAEKVDFTDYDCLILGAGVRDGKIYKPIRDILKKNKDILLQKKTGYFICNEKQKKTEEIIADNFADDLQKSAVCIQSFGGYKAYAAPKEGMDQLKGLNIEAIKVFAQKFK